MPRDHEPVMVPPGEDLLDLPLALGWFVESCTRIRRALRGFAAFPPRARPPARVCRS
jgi:hypothetical protein